MFLANVLNWIKLPESSQVKDLDNPENIHLIRKIIKRKPFLFKTYKSFYIDLLNRVENVPPNGKIVELGSGASFLKKYAPDVLTSDILPYDGVDKVFSALNMPLNNSSVSAFLAVDVFHHLKDSRQFFSEARRCLKLGGKIVMIEPANTIWSKFIYTNFHHEPFKTDGEWGFEEGGPLTGANMAIPWIVFFRDRDVFNQEFSQFKVCSTSIHTPLKYLLSGGLSMRQLLPSWLYYTIQMIEWLLSPFNQYIGMFMTIEIEKISEQ